MLFRIVNPPPSKEEFPPAYCFRVAGLLFALLLTGPTHAYIWDYYVVV